MIFMNYIVCDVGKLYYVGKSQSLPSLVIEFVDEKEQIIKTIHEDGHLGNLILCI